MVPSESSSRLTFSLWKRGGKLWQRGGKLTYLFLLTQRLYGADCALNTFHILTHAIPINTCEFVIMIISHLTDKDTEAQRG